ncbi:UNVERIFIED_CONTAM: putative B3 domain-containing protein [Sesamum radiatum]|uniref:B3 domain-containing protein n=1 Tax=Sesamum radiatum TaxID=300843 RepID=A0AAW2W5V7_SESRA
MSSSTTHLSDDAAAKPLIAAAIASAEREPHYYSFIVPSSTDDEEAIPPTPITPLPRHNKGKRKMYEFFDEAPRPPIETGVSTRLTLSFAAPPTFNHTRTTAIGPSMKMAPALSSFPMSSTQLFHAHYDKGEGKIPQIFDFFASEGKVPCDTTTPPTDETGVSTHLSLCHFAGAGYSPPAPRGVVVVPGDSPALPEDRWEIKKVLTKSDVDDSSRLLLAKVDVQAHIVPHVMGDGRGLDEGEGVEVGVWDLDRGSEHVLVLKKWKSGSFVLMKNWMSEFVRRRGLEKNDEIGLRWDDGNSSPNCQLGVQVELSRLASSRVGSHSSSARARAYRARAEPARARALGELELELFRFCS